MHPQYQRLEENIRRAIAAYRRGRLARGASLLLLALLGSIGLLLLIAHFFPSAVLLRWLTLGASMSAVVFVFIKHVLRPWQQTPTPQQVARRLEESHPDLEDRLATVVEYGDQQFAPDAQEMLRRLLNEVAMQTAHFNFSRQVAAPHAGAWKIFSLLAVAGALIVLIGFFNPLRQNLSELFSTRLNLLPGALTVLPGDASVRRGSAVTVEAQTPETTIDTVVLYFSTEDTSWSSQSMMLVQPGRFKYELFGVEDTLRYYVRAVPLGGMSPIFRLTPLEAPVLRSIRLKYRYPTALGLSPKTTTGSGDVYGPPGTKVQITATFSDVLSSASVQIGEGDPEPARRVSDSLLTAEIEIKADGFYRLLAAGANGIESEPLDYLIHLQPDEPPAITLQRPGRDARVTMLEEVMIETSVLEDYELKKYDLVYTINDGTPQRVSMLERAQSRQAGTDEDAAGPRHEFTAAHLLYLEDFNVEPGDFISYYVEAADRSQSQASDIYFLEVRPFEEEFYMAVSQGGGAGSLPNSLSISQKEIIVATWKLERERGSMSEKEVENKSQAIAEAQAGVRDTIEQLRAMLAAQGEGGPMGEYFERAIEAMRRAEEQLEAARLAEALAPEREAYNYLLKADAEIRRRDLQRGSANASGAQAQSQEELQRLFADELDKMQSKYETLQNNQRREEEQKVSEALEKVRDLAQRQQRLNDMNRDLARQQLAEEERRRQIARLKREQETLNREAQELGRRVRQLNRQAERDEQRLAENLRQAAEEMSRATNSLNRDNPSSAAAEGRRAVERLEQLESQLRRSAAQSLQQRVADLRQDFRKLAEAQRQLADSVAHGRSSDNRSRQWQQNQQRLRARADELSRQLRDAERGAAKDQPEVAQGLRRISEELKKSEALRRMEQSEAALADNHLEESERPQRQALRALQKAGTDLEQVQSLLAQSNEEKLDMALQQTQNLRRDLERQLRQAELPQGQEQRNNNPANQPQGAEASRSQQELRPEEMNWWSERLWQAMDQLERMRPMVSGDSALADEFSSLQKNLSGMVRTFRGGDAQRLTDIENKIIDPLRRFESELATRLALLQQRQRLATAQDEQVPAEYREMVDKYFEALARSKKK
jgi:hypothetical protein